MGNLVGAMTLSERRISDESKPTLEIQRQKSRELTFKGKPDPIVVAISKALDDPDSSPLSTHMRKSFQESEI
jgi:hypothetical protein